MGNFFLLIYVNVATITMISQPHFTKTVVEQVGFCQDLCGFLLEIKTREPQILKDVRIKIKTPSKFQVPDKVINKKQMKHMNH